MLLHDTTREGESEANVRWIVGRTRRAGREAARECSRPLVHDFCGRAIINNVDKEGRGGMDAPGIHLFFAPAVEGHELVAGDGSFAHGARGLIWMHFQPLQTESD